MQDDAAVAELADGRFVAAWSGRGEGDSQGVFVRFVDANGTPTGDELLVNETTHGNQQNPAVTATPDGGFVVAWDGHGHEDGGHFWWHALFHHSSSNEVFFRRFDSSGNPLGPEIRANETSKGEQQDADVATLDDGSIVVTWSGRGSGDSSGVFVRQFDATGTPLGDESLVNEFSNGKQQDASIAALSEGGFVIAWNDRGAGGKTHHKSKSHHNWFFGRWDDEPDEILARRFDNNAEPLGNQFLVNETTEGRQRNPDVAALDSGGFVVAWDGKAGLYSHWWWFCNSDDVFARRFDVDGQPREGEVLVNQTTFGNQNNPSVAGLADGRFVVTWDGKGTGDYSGVFVREFDVTARPEHDEQRVNSTTYGTQSKPAIASRGQDYQIAWDGKGRGDTHGVFTHFFDINIAPDVAANLQNDTAPDDTTNTDGVTSDPTILGTVSADNDLAALRAGFNTTLPEFFTDVTAAVAANGGILLDTDLLDDVFGGTLPDGVHVLRLQAEDVPGLTSDIAEVAFTLDTTPPAIALSTPANGEQTNTNPTVAGQVTDLLAGVYSLEAQIDGGSFFSVLVQPDGNFSFGAALSTTGGDDGVHTIRLRAEDVAGNDSPLVERTFTLDTQPPVIEIATPAAGTETSENVTVSGTVGDNLTGVAELEARIDGATFFDVAFDVSTGAYSFDTALLLDGSDDGEHTVDLQATDNVGNVSPLETVTFTLETAPAIARLVEGTDFTVVHEETIVVPGDPATLRIDYENLLFDLTDSFVNDAFEAALVDSLGQPLVHTIAGSHDAFFNITEGESA